MQFREKICDLRYIKLTVLIYNQVTSVIFFMTSQLDLCYSSFSILLTTITVNYMNEIFVLMNLHD